MLSIARLRQCTDWLSRLGSDSTLLSAGSNPAVVKSIMTDYRDLVFGVHQSLDLPEATSPIPSNDLCSAWAIVEFLLQVYYKK